MADNITIPTTGSGTATPVVATDDVGGIHYQKVKIALGADGVIDTLVDSGQQTSANSVPVVIASDQSNVPVSIAAGNTQYTEDAAAAANPVGNALILVREDALAGSLTTADGDNVAARGNNKGEQYVKDADATSLLNDLNTLTTNIEAVATVVGGGVEANALRVTIASDSTGVVSVDDNGGSLTVDGSVVVSNILDGAGDSVMDATNNAVRVNIVAGAAAGGTSITDDGAFTPASSALTPIGGMFDDVSPDTIDEGDAGVARMTSYRALHVNLRDNSGNELAVGGGTQYTEDAAAAANPVGTALMLVREDARAGTLTSADGDNVAARGNNRGELYVKDTDAASLLTTLTAIVQNEDDAHDSTDSGVMALAVRRDTAASGASADGDYATLNTDASGRLWTRDDLSLSELENITNNTNTLAQIARDEDSAHVSQDYGVPMLAVRRDTAAVGSGTDGDYSTVNVDGSGRVWAHDPVAEALLTEAVGHLDNLAGGFVPAYTEDAAAPANPTGGVLMMVRDDGLVGGVTSANGDVIAARANNRGEQYVRDSDLGAYASLISISLAVMDDWDESDRAKVNIIAGQAGVTAGAGTVAANTPRVTLASDDPAVVALQLLDNAVSGAGFNVTQLGGAAVPLGGGTEATALRVTIASDSTGVLSVDDNGGSLTVDATGNVAHDAADSGNPVKVGHKAKAFDGTPPGTAAAEDDRVDSVADLYGRQYVETTHPNFWDASVDYASAQTNASIKAAPGAGLRLYITDVIISNGATAGNITLLDGSGGTVKFEVYPGVNGGAAHSFRTPLRLSDNTALVITSTTVTTHSVTVSGYIAP